MKRIELIEYLYSKGLNNTEIEDLLKNTLSEIKNHKLNSLMDDFFDSTSISLLNRFEYMDFDLSEPVKLIEFDIFNLVEKWHSTGKLFKNISELIDIESSVFFEKGVTVKEYSSRSVPDIIKIINKLELSDSFELGLNGYDYFIEGTLNEWRFFASKKEILFYVDLTNWFILKKDDCVFSKNKACYRITKNYLMDGSSKSQLEMYTSILAPAEIEHIKNLDKTDYVRAYETTNVIASYLFNYSYEICDNKPPLNSVSIKKNIENVETYGFIIDTNTKNYQLFIKPKCLCNDSEVYISSLGYIQNSLSYIGMGILFDKFDAVDNSYDFEQKLQYAFEYQVSNFAHFCVFMEYVLTNEANIPTVYGTYSPEQIPFGVSVRTYKNQDKNYIESLLKDELNIVIRDTPKKLIHDRSVKSVSHLDFLKLKEFLQ